VLLSNVHVVAGEGQQLRGGDRRLPDQGNTDPCLDLPGSEPCDTLGKLVVELKKIVPRKGGEYNKPKTTTLNEWKKVIGLMLEGKCREIDLNNYTGLNKGGRYKLYKFKDTTVTGKPKYYCVFTSTKTKSMTNNRNGAVYAWGTFITRIRQADENVTIYNLSIDVPHPLADTNTYEQGVQIYKDSQARSMYLAGAHRETVSDKSDCGGYNKADASHNYQHPLTFTTMAVKDYWTNQGRKFAVIQIHGKGETTCESSAVFVADGAADTNGNRQSPGSIAEKFKVNLETPLLGLGYSIDTVKTNPTCDLGATQNVQARFLNGMIEKKDICNIGILDGRTGEWITDPNGTFLQIEQNIDVRKDPKSPKVIGDAIRKTFDSPEYYRK